MRRRTHLAATPLVVLAALLLPSGKPADAQTKPLRLSLASPGASAWETVKGGRLRLVTAPHAPDGTATAAIEIELEPGFKTYWWNPGADGIPPQVAFLGSRNVAKAALTLPPPQVFRESTVTVGYTGNVRFPIAVETADPAQGYRLAASGIVGFCADICVPVPFNFAASPPLRPTGRAILASATTGVVEPSDELHLADARFDPETGRLEVDARVPDTDVLLELVVANPEDILLPPAATTVHQKGDKATFTFELGEDVTLSDEQELTFTLLVAQFGQEGRIGVEQTLPVALVE